MTVLESQTADGQELNSNKEMNGVSTHLEDSKLRQRDYRMSQRSQNYQPHEIYKYHKWFRTYLRGYCMKGKIDLFGVHEGFKYVAILHTSFHVALV
jgi:hypothetical protein